MIQLWSSLKSLFDSRNSFNRSAYRPDLGSLKKSAAMLLAGAKPRFDVSFDTKFLKKFELAKKHLMKRPIKTFKTCLNFCRQLLCRPGHVKSVNQLEWTQRKSSFVVDIQRESTVQIYRAAERKRKILHIQRISKSYFSLTYGTIGYSYCSIAMSHKLRLIVYESSKMTVYETHNASFVYKVV